MHREQVKIMMTMALSAPEDTRGEIFRCMRAMDDERKETCIHCRSVWYAIHFKDGVCHGCQQKRMPGRSEIEAQRRRRALATFFFVKLPVFAAIVLAAAGLLLR